METSEARRLIAAGETLHSDRKRAFGSHRELAKDLVCFANTDGGTVLFGVADDGKVVGVDDPDRLSEIVDEVAYEHCEPPVPVLVEVAELPEGTVVVVRIPRGDSRPYRTKSGQYYVRAPRRCRQASREELLRLFQATGSLYYDEAPWPRATLSDLDLDALHQYLAEAGLEELREDDPRPLLRSWRLLEGETPTLAGLLLFGRRPQQQIPYAQINAARFAGTDSGSDPLDRTDLTGRLLEVIAAAEYYLRLTLPTPHVVRDFEPESHPELPLTALREAIVNAVAHRDYTVRGPVRLFVFDDRIEVHTPGRAPNTVDEAAMRAGVHVVRNPHLYARLSDAGLVTRAGTGVRRMDRLVREATGRPLGLTLTDYEVLVTLPRPRP